MNGASVVDDPVKGTINDDDSVTDDPLVHHETPVRAVHLAELRTQIDQLRAAHGMTAFAWTTAAPVAGGTPLVAHVTDLRAALAQVYTHARQSAPVYAVDPALTTGMPIKLEHVSEIREKIRVAP